MISFGCKLQNSCISKYCMAHVCVFSLHLLPFTKTPCLPCSFGTDVMVTVAKNLDGPIKILFPRGHNADTGKLELSLLGLGDIVIPGFFLALLLRFDAHNAGEMSGDAHAKFKKPYFHSALIAYILGLATTLYVMVAFNAAQPALLYLVPACLGSSLLCALVRGELKELFAYSEEEEEEEEENTAEAVKEEVEQAKKDK